MSNFIIDRALRDDFVARIGKGKTKYSLSFKGRSIKSIQDVKQAVIDCYNSGVPFQTAKQKYKCYSGYLGVLEAIAAKIFEYFNGEGNVPNNQANFDDFHAELCRKFLAEMHDLGATFSYGNAQKLINMAFKYLSCYSDYEAFADLFSYCHMPIDGVILEALENRYHVVGVRHRHFGGKPWTAFEENHYLELVKNYRDALDPIRGNNCYLAVDHYLWGGSVVMPSTGTATATIGKFFRQPKNSR